MKSFNLYVESGMREVVEADIDILSGHLAIQSDEFKAEFCKIIIDHLLRKFHCFFVLDTSNYFSLPKYSPPR